MKKRIIGKDLAKVLRDPSMLHANEVYYSGTDIIIRLPKKEVCCDGGYTVELPERVMYIGNIHGANEYFSQLSRLPDDFWISGSLNLVDTKVKRLPKNLYVGGCLTVSYPQIKKLPEGMHVSGDLILKQYPKIVLPNKFFVGGFIRDDK